MASGPNERRVPVWPAILFLLWNLMGCAAFAFQSTMNLEELAKTDPLQAEIWAAMPVWAWAAYLVAVVSGTLGAIALLLKRNAAVLLSALCVVAVLVQFGYTFLLTDLIELRGWGTAIFPFVILLLAVAQTLYASRLAGRGLLR